MKKFVLFAAAGLLTTATIVYASFEKKPDVRSEPVKKETTKKEPAKKKSDCNKKYKTNCTRYLFGTT